MSARATILLADDHVLLLEAFRRMLEPRFEVVGTAVDGRADGGCAEYRMMETLSLRSSAELVGFAVRNGLS